MKRVMYFVGSRYLSGDTFPSEDTHLSAMFSLVWINIHDIIFFNRTKIIFMIFKMIFCLSECLKLFTHSKRITYQQLLIYHLNAVYYNIF